jgi:Protein of unknown function (DUF998)
MMTQKITAPARPSGATLETTRPTRALLACGVVAGPLFLAVALLQALTRDGFDLGRHPLSLLSLGELGWIQIANFVVAGLLSVAFAVGLRRVLHPGRGGTWGPLLVGAYGVGLIGGGVFIADLGAGFPPGAPAGAPEQLSWHGILHDVAHVLAFLALMAACFVLAHRFAAFGQRGWATYCVATRGGPAGAHGVAGPGHGPGAAGRGHRAGLGVAVGAGGTAADRTGKRDGTRTLGG